MDEPSSQPSPVASVLDDAVAPGSESGSSLDDAMAGARPGAPAALVVARARIADALFGADAGSGLGRFRVLERLGSGGMGVVYAAYDPDLDRSVALKIVRVPAAGRAAALAEARAMARLSHPNVVPIYDVGIEGEHVYMVMEHVRGETLGRWTKTRDRREVLQAYRQAGEALAAAHAVGLVHRDFKPDNAIVGGDGRVRVVDFGLACEAAVRTEPPTPAPAAIDAADRERPADQPRQVAGTRGYMAPEQAAGGAVSPAADQYSFCVALTRALAATDAPPPRRLAAALARGTATDPAARFPSMAELLRVLARDRARTVRRAALALAVAAAVAGLAFLAGARHAAPDVDTCSGGEAALAATYRADTRTAAFARIAAMNAYGRELAAILEPALVEHAARWTAGYRDACRAHRRGAQSDALFDRRMACLERGRVAFGALADIIDHAVPAALPGVAQAVRALPDPDECADVGRFLAEVAPPPPPIAGDVGRLRGELEVARVEIAAGRYAQGTAHAARVVALARTLGHRPLIARALLTQGLGMMRGDAIEAGGPVLDEAQTIALAAGDDEVAVEAWARRAYCLGLGTRAPAGALDGRAVVEALAERPAVGRYARALLYRQIGMVEVYLDHPEAARAALARADAESRGLTGANAIEFLSVRANLALLSPDPVSADPLFAQVIADKTRLLGADHPTTLESRVTRGQTTMVALGEAEAYLAPTCATLDASYPDLAVTSAQPCWVAVGFMRAELGDRAGALAAVERAARIGGPDGPDPLVDGYAALWRGDAADAAARFARQLAVGTDELAWQREDRAEASLGLGQARRALGDLAGARTALERSIPSFVEVLRAHPGLPRDRRLTRARAELAYVLASQGAAPAAIAPLAAEAAASLRRMGGLPAEIARLDALAVTGAAPR